MRNFINGAKIQMILNDAKNSIYAERIEKIFNLDFVSESCSISVGCLLNSGEIITRIFPYNAKLSTYDNIQNLAIFLDKEAYDISEQKVQSIIMENKLKVEKYFSELRSNMIEFNDDVYYIQYNKESDTIEIGTCCNSGLMVDYSYQYDHFFDLDHNLQEAIESFEDHLRELSMI